VFLYLSKILPALLAPFSVVLLLLLGALLFRKWRTPAVVAAFLVLLIPSCPVVSDFLIWTLERQDPDIDIEALPSAEAIVVLGGSIHGPGGTHRSSRLEDSSDRLFVALRLYHAGKAPLILCSGGNLSLFGETKKVPEAQFMKSAMEEWGIPAGIILTEGGSVNTHENAQRSHEILAARGIHRILLVTSAMHMPRAAATFRKSGFEVIPAPADYFSGWDKQALDWIPNPGAMGSSERALRGLSGIDCLSAFAGSAVVAHGNRVSNLVPILSPETKSIPRPRL
jgi:uncharacterized SAM-binding protein YcdF (DUF218 family)